MPAFDRQGIQALLFSEFLVTLVALLSEVLGSNEELLIYIFSIFTGIRSLWHFGLLGELSFS